MNRKNLGSQIRDHADNLIALSSAHHAQLNIRWRDLDNWPCNAASGGGGGRDSVGHSKAIRGCASAGRVVVQGDESLNPWKTDGLEVNPVIQLGRAVAGQGACQLAVVDGNYEGLFMCRYW
jgi:hypothetical protein